MAGKLTLCLVPSALTRPILDGEVVPEGLELDTSEGSSVNALSNRMLDRPYDIAEMSFATYTRMRAQRMGLIALPLFTGRRFMQPAVVFSPAAGLRDPSELRGRRVVVPQFWQTSSVWHRIVLRQAHDVSQEEVRWITTAPERISGLGAPPGVELRLDTSGRGAAELVAAGEAEAAMAAAADPKSDARLVGAYPDPLAAQKEYYQQTSVLPILHLIVLKEEVVREQPRAVGALCEAFAEAKRRNLAKAFAGRENPLVGGSAEQTRALLGEDPWPYGVGANRRALDTFLDHVQRQGLTDRRLATEVLFPPELPEGFR